MAVRVCRQTCYFIGQFGHGVFYLYLLAKIPVPGCGCGFQRSLPGAGIFCGSFFTFYFLLLHQRLKFLHIFGSIAFKDC